MNGKNGNPPEVIDGVIVTKDDVAQQSMRTYSMIVYGLYALGLFLGGLPTLIGLIMAYLKRNEFRGTIYHGHMTLLIRTFWYSLVVSFLGAVLALIYIGYVILFAVGVWYIYRLVRGFICLYDRKGVWWNP
jgi:uncharacterized membrane protein